MARELSTPWRPPVVDQTDTSMFDAYPDSDEIAPTPCLGVAEDPFADFGSSNISTSLERRKRPGTIEHPRDEGLLCFRVLAHVHFSLAIH